MKKFSFFLLLFALINFSFTPPVKVDLSDNLIQNPDQKCDVQIKSITIDFSNASSIVEWTVRVCNKTGAQSLPGYVEIGVGWCEESEIIGHEYTSIDPFTCLEIKGTVDISACMEPGVDLASYVYDIVYVEAVVYADDACLELVTLMKGGY